MATFATVNGEQVRLQQAVVILDPDGNIVSSFGGGAGGATAAKQDEQTGELTNISGDTAQIRARLPASLGQKDKAESLAVTLASDEDALTAELAAADPGLVALATAIAGATPKTLADLQAVLGATTGLAITGNLDGSIQQYLRGLIALWNAGPGFSGYAGVPSWPFTRPSDTTPYAAGDLVANSTTAGSVAPFILSVGRTAGGSGMIRRARLKTSSTNLTNASFRLHLYGTAPTVTNGDNGVFLSNQSATYLGSIDMTLDKAFSDGAAGTGIPLVGSEINFSLASGLDIYGLLEARAAYTPTSAGTFKVELEVIQN